MTWRQDYWYRSDTDSVVSLFFTQNDDGTALMELYQVNIPAEDLFTVKRLWKRVYFRQWKKWIKGH